MSRRPDLWKAELRDREAARKAELRDREAARKAADAEREPPAEHVCAECGVFGASFGFGCFRNRSDGLWSCADAACLAIVEARAAMPPMPAEPARADPPAADLFGRSAA